MSNKTAIIPAHVAKDRVVMRLVEAEKALAYAVGIDQVKLVMDVAAAQQVFATRQKMGEDVIGYAYAIKSRALAKLGELLREMEKQAGGRGRKGGGRNRGSSKELQLDAPPTLADLGLTKKVASVAQQLAGLPADTREAIHQRETTIAAARREIKAVELKRTVSLPEAKFRVLYADPPWSYNDKADEGAVQAGGSGRHYPSMSIADLCAMKIKAICEDNAVLFLWVTSPLLFEAAPVIAAWGFQYKASFVWDKIKHNMGHYNSVRHEFLLICTRGSCPPDKGAGFKLFDSVQSIERTGHSVKPERFREIITALYPHGKRLELFAKVAVKGWERYGFEAPAVA